jgi:hypothetical protein
MNDLFYDLIAKKAAQSEECRIIKSRWDILKADCARIHPTRHQEALMVNTAIEDLEKQIGDYYKAHNVTAKPGCFFCPVENQKGEAFERQWKIEKLFK